MRRVLDDVSCDEPELSIGVQVLFDVSDSGKVGLANDGANPSVVGSGVRFRLWFGRC